jgi:Domain of unknown function (DUF6456)
MNELVGNHRDLPDWLPEGASRYLAHTEAGQSIRNLARLGGVHASTVLRQVRRMETRRDDPLVDGALTALAETHYTAAPTRRAADNKKDPDHMTHPDNQSENLPDSVPDSATLTREACRVLPRLCETGAVLAVAEQMEKAVVVRDTGAGGAGARTAVVDRAIARAMALQDWISCAAPGRISRYRITAAGRAALAQMLAQGENRARDQQDHGFAEAQAGFSGASVGESANGTPSRPRRSRYNAAESPLSALARRKDRDGQPFLDAELVQAGERLREDFELSQMGPRVTQNWDNFLTSGTGGSHGAGGPDGSSLARDRMTRALGDLGQGLGDVALRCCCYLEGLEVAEKRLGWSARSGKIVLRIALQRLRQHYEGLSGPDRMIG